MIRHALFTIPTIISLLFGSISLAQWNPDGVPVCIQLGNQEDPRILFDRSGGAIIIWRDGRRGAEKDIYAQKIDADGYVQWVPDGVPICTADGELGSFVAISDDSGGAFIAWSERRTGVPRFRVYAQAVDSDGMVRWIEGGIVLSDRLPWYRQVSPRITSDGAGGVLVAWLDIFVEGFPEPPPWDLNIVSAQRVDPNGKNLWGNGRMVTDASPYYSPRIVSDGVGGAFIAWVEILFSGDLSIARLDAAGSTLWSKHFDGSGELDLELVSDDAEGVIFTWAGLAQKLDSNGVERWGDGIQTHVPAMVITDGEGGAIFGGAKLQRIDAEGNVRWAPGGVVAGSGTDIHINTDFQGGALLAWSDTSIFAQRVTSSGMLLWENNGSPVYSDTFTVKSPSINSDGIDQAIVAWCEKRNGNFNIYAQRVEFQFHAPVLDSIGNKEVEVNEDLIFQLAASDHDSEDTLTYSTDAGDILPSVFSFDEHTGLFAWTPQEGDAGDYLVTFNVTDGLFFDEETITISVFQNGNRPPILGPINEILVFEKQVVAIIPHATDPDGDSVFYSIDDPRYVRIGNGFVWRTDIGDAGVYHPIVTATDGYLADSEAVLVEVYPFVPFVHDPMAVDTSTYFNWMQNGVSWNTVDDGYITNGAVSWDGGIISRRVFPSSQNPVVVVRCNKGTTNHMFGFSDLEPSLSDFHYRHIDHGIYIHSSGSIRPTWEKNNAGYWSTTLPEGTFDVRIFLVASSGEIHFEIEQVGVYGDSLSDFIEPFWSSVESRTIADTYYIQVNPYNTQSKVYDIWSMFLDERVATVLQSFSASLDGTAVSINWTMSEWEEDSRFYILRMEASEKKYSELFNSKIVRQDLSFTFKDNTCDPGKTYRYRLDVENDEGRRILFVTEPVTIPVISLTLYQNIPNPFNPWTKIQYYLPKRFFVSLGIYDVVGRRVTRLVNQIQEEGLHSVQWNGQNSKGNHASSGVYFYQLRAGSKVLTKKMVVVR